MPSSPSTQIEARRRRQRFYYRHLHARLDVPREELLRTLCEEWREAARADWVWLWLYNSASRSFELVSSTLIDGKPPMPETRPDPAGLSCCKWSCLTGRVAFANDVNAWAMQHEGETYSVKMGMDFNLGQLGTRAMIVVPLPSLLAPDPGNPLERYDHRLDNLSTQHDVGDHVGALSLHYASEIPDNMLPKSSLSICPPNEATLDDAMGEPSLLLMAGLSSLVIARKWQADQIQVARELAHLAEQHLTRYQADPRTVRADFLDAVLKLLQKHLRVEAASVFLRAPYEDSIQCVSSTGLVRMEDGKHLATRADKLDAKYAPNEGRTGRVYADPDGRPQVFFDENSDTGKFSETSKSGHPKHGGTVVYPIRTLQADVEMTESNKPETVGVIRCSYPCDNNFSEANQAFDEAQIRMLRFIVEQISPTLHTLEARIKRELMIQIVRHDLLAPLSALRDGADQISSALSQRRLPDPYYVDNLQEHALRMAHLADLLARDVSARRQIKPKRIRLLSDIIAPMRRILTPFANETSRMEIMYDGFDSVAINADPVLVERALFNLVMNAIKYGTRDTKVYIRGVLLKDGFAIDVENTGIGVTSEEKGKLFRGQYRTPRAIAMRLGEGLGLMIVKSIMESHEGSVELVSGDSPTVFRLRFPQSRVCQNTR